MIPWESAFEGAFAGEMGVVDLGSGVGLLGTVAIGCAFAREHMLLELENRDHCYRPSSFAHSFAFSPINLSMHYEMGHEVLTD